MNCNTGHVLFLIVFGVPLVGVTERLQFPCH
jgi:hypothetical protein